MKTVQKMIGLYMSLLLVACGSQTTATPQEDVAVIENTTTVNESAVAATTNTITTTLSNDTEGAMINGSELFTERDLTQSVSLDGATTYTLKDGEDITITEEGTYVLTGSSSNTTVFVEAASEAKVQIVLDSVEITNDTTPCIYVKSADKVFITTTSSTNTLSVKGTFTADGETNTDGVIFSKDDVVVNGVGTLNITSSDNGIVSKDDLKVTGGTVQITCMNNGLEANDSIAIADGTITIDSNDDGLHAGDDEDDTIGYIYIGGGNLTINAVDDAIHATTILQVDNGNLTLNAAEGLEATYIQLNEGTMDIKASDDGVNAANKSTSYTPTIEINGGSLTIQMGSGDTDAIDSNGNLLIHGGTLDLNAQSPFDYDEKAEYTGGTIIVNGVEVNQISNQMMGGPMSGQMGGQMGGPMGGPMGGNHQGQFGGHGK